MRHRRRKSLAAQSIALGLAVPQVLAHRMARMDAKEFQLMGTEKLAAFHEAWGAMAVQTALENQKLALSLMQAFWFPWMRQRSSLARQVTDAGMSILAEGMAPVRRRAAANARRLGRPRRQT